MKNKGYVLIVKDTDISKRFYQDVIGVTIQVDLGAYVMFKENFSLLQEETWLQFNGKKDLTITYHHNSGELYFEEDMLDAFAGKLLQRADIQVLTPIKEYEWGQRSMKFYDPDGHVFEVGESMEMVVKRFLRSGMSVEETVQKSMFPLPFVEMCRDELLQQ